MIPVAASTTPKSSRVAARLRRHRPVQERFVHFAESGFAIPPRDDAWSELTHKVGSAGLGSLSTLLDDALQSPAALLRVTDVVSLYRQLG